MRLERGWVRGGVDPRGPQARPKQVSQPTGTPPLPPMLDRVRRSNWRPEPSAGGEGWARGYRGAGGTMNPACSRITGGCQSHVSPPSATTPPPPPLLAGSGVLQPQASGQRLGLTLGTDGSADPLHSRDPDGGGTQRSHSTSQPTRETKEQILLGRAPQDRLKTPFQHS